MAEEGKSRQKNVLPDTLKEHTMADKYKFINYDEESDLWKPGNPDVGEFVINRPHATFAMTSYFNKGHDPFPGLEENTMEEGDILLCSPQKTGTHLTYEIIRMLVSGEAEYRKNPKEETWIEIHPYKEIMQVPVYGRRILNTHLVPGWIPPNFRRPDTKMIATMRNPKDAFISYFHHQIRSLGTIDDAEKKRLWPEYFTWLLRHKRVGWDSFLLMFADIWEHREDQNMLIVFFEDLKNEETIKKIADHLGVACSQKLLDDVMDACDINKMRDARGKMEGEMFYRKGEIGDWKNYFTVEQNEDFHKVYDEWNKEKQIPFRFE